MNYRNSYEPNSDPIEESDELRLCTFPITSTNPTFQEIFICHTCKKVDDFNGIPDQDDHHNEVKRPMPLCVCESCAVSCHEDLGHDVEYIGSGPSYCDCAIFLSSPDSSCSCVLQDRSRQMAKTLGIKEGKLGSNYAIEYSKEWMNASEFPYTYEVFSIPSITADCDKLIDQALELIKHSTDTHWIPSEVMDGSSCVDLSSLCLLEQLAIRIFQRHVKEYNLKLLLNREDDTAINESGAEWWVQVKYPESNTEAVDLHYDKDEELASAFNLGSFPTLSTVTYLTDNILNDDDCAAPTLVFSHSYEMLDDGPIGLRNQYGAILPQLLVSHSRVGKHLVFDGKLLHGAPSHKALRQNLESIRNSNDRIESRYKGVRVTFLVNIWLNPPSKVLMLPNDIREKIKMNASQSQNINDIQIEKRIVTLISVSSSDQDRIKLPFVSSGATWIEGNEDDEEGLVVSLIPPPEHENDTVIVKYCNDDLEPYLEHIGGDYISNPEE